MFKPDIGTPAVGYEWGIELPTIPGKHIRLRPLNEGDVPALFEIFSNVEVMRYWDSPALKSPADAAALLQRIQDNFKRRTLFQWGIEEARGGLVIGTCTLFRLDTNHRRAEIGFALARAAWGHGFMTDALDCLIDFAFSKVGLHRLEADADPRNCASLRALERQGFRREGLLRERYLQNGEVQDAVFLGLLSSERTRGR